MVSKPLAFSIMHLIYIVYVIYVLIGLKSDSKCFDHDVFVNVLHIDNVNEHMFNESM